MRAQYSNLAPLLNETTIATITMVLYNRNCNITLEVGAKTRERGCSTTKTAKDELKSSNYLYSRDDAAMMYSVLKLFLSPTI